MYTRTLVATAFAAATLALGACDQVGGAHAMIVKPGYPAPLSEPPTSLSAPAASHDYGPIPVWANHPAPGTDARIALATDAKARAAAAPATRGHA
jgi:hypothetical protein